MIDKLDTNILSLTAQIIAAHIAHNTTVVDALPGLIANVYRTLASAGDVVAKPDDLLPAVPIKKSVFSDYIVCLEDGKKLKMLKRHLRISYNLTPTEYRTRWSLPSDYPMVAPNYATRRSDLARQNGLGLNPAQRTAKPKAQPTPEIAVAKLPARRAKGSRG